MNPDARLIAADLDGTLLRDDGTVSEHTRRSIARAQGMGIVVVLVTARPPRILRVMVQDVGVSGLAICCNGAIVYDLAADAIVQHAPLAAAMAQRLVVALREAAPGVCFAVEQGLRFGREPRYVALRPASGDHTPLIDDALVLSLDGVTKLIVLHPEVPHQDLLRITREIAGNEAIVTHSSTLFVEVSAAGVTKAVALQELCAGLGIEAAQVMAFGDMPNDLPMRAASSVSAYPPAMGS